MQKGWRIKVKTERYHRDVEDEEHDVQEKEEHAQSIQSIEAIGHCEPS
jgi:hypothetical protein